ncbi:hypothetical protein OUZ56_033638 [Daphnia magna]|uniref:Uncharacterized protein n=1 Tax=Daphnia magna TaxID=35525 RepID=A0ABR0BAY5_9CRUS|nr:hypothetical protein OUZ56_033638 [Daphnia magna]
MEIIDDTETAAEQELPKAASLTLEQTPELPMKNEISESTSNAKLVWKQHENKLAKEIREYHLLLCTYKRTLNKGSEGGTGSMPEEGHRANSLKVTHVSTKN